MPVSMSPAAKESALGGGGRAVDASDAERRRVAAALHDGPVQELVATSFAAAGAAARGCGGPEGSCHGAVPSVVTPTRCGTAYPRCSRVPALLLTPAS